MSYETILFEIKNNIATITLNRTKKLNAFNQLCLKEIKDALSIADENSRCLVLTGAGQAFCAGADLWGEGLADFPPEERGEIVRLLMVNQFNPIISIIDQMSIPTISAINGIVAGGGLGFALSCDIIIAKKSSKFIAGFAKDLGLIPDLGTTWFLTHFSGRARALGIAFLGDPFYADEAEKMGLIWRSVEENKFISYVESTAQKLAEGPTHIYPEIRKIIAQAANNTLKEQLALEANKQPKFIATDEFKEGMLAFSEKRSPNFTKLRDPKGGV